VVVSTDDPRVAAACREQGASVPFIRPSELATSATSLISVLQHALTWLETNEDYTPDWVLLMTITYPFRRDGFVDHFVATVLQSQVDSAFTAVLERNAHWYTDEDGRPQLVSFGVDTARAHKPPLYKEMSGLALMVRREVVLSGTLYGVELGIIPVTDPWATINIHDEIGRQLADLLAPQFNA
jgi:CMP-N-acetylneuraminic acid synthetase